MPVRNEKAVPFPVKMETVFDPSTMLGTYGADRIYRIYGIICPGWKPGQIVYPLGGGGIEQLPGSNSDGIKDFPRNKIVLVTGDGCLHGCVRQPCKISG